MSSTESSFVPLRNNLILYCEAWQATIEFYSTILRLPISFRNDWFVEFGLSEKSFLSVANAARSTIRDVQGQGITLSWQIADLEKAKCQLEALGVATSQILRKWNANLFYIHDPAGHRIEFWEQ